MAETKHAADMERRTPWYVGAQNDGLYIIDQPPRPSNDDIDPDRDCRVVAKVYQQPGEDRIARVLAAAPDLLAACQEVKRYLDRMGLDWLGKGPDPLEAAIARATGQDQKTTQTGVF